MSTPVTNFNFAIGGWGTTASFTVSPGSTQNRGSVVITASSGAINDAFNPFVLFTYPDGAYPLAPLAYAQYSFGTGQSSDIAITTTTTQTLYTYDGLPLNGQTYAITYDVLGI